jgi:hypothetical protein
MIVSQQLSDSPLTLILKPPELTDGLIALVYNASNFIS